jgi:hypothetical protein
MIKKTPLTFWIAGLLTALAIIISGCSTKKPWGTNPNIPFAVSFISAPTDSVPANSHTSFSWAVTGGTGAVTSQYRVGDNAWSEQAAITTATLTGLTVGTFTFSVQAQDAEGHTATVSQSFVVKAAEAVPPDTIPPTVVIVQSPAESSYIAVGSVVAFAWTGSDSPANGSELLFQYTFAGETSEWLPIRSIAFNNVAAANPATFTVQAKDAAGNVSTIASMMFIIKVATILYIDDYQWLDTYGNVDGAKERDQKGFYREALKGYAFAEWDNDAMGRIPTMADLTGITTIIWAADDNLCSADPNYRLWYDIGDSSNNVLEQFMNAGGHLLITGSQVLYYLNHSNPPASTDFEAAYLGISDTMVAVIDTTATPPDTTYEKTWLESLTDFSAADFTWAIKSTETSLDLPDSMKIDVAKNGTQLACVSSLVYLKRGVRPLFTVGLDVDGAEPGDYGLVCGWLYRPGATTISASLMFDTYSMPAPGIRQTFHTILNQFGEGPGL